jgi:GMP synthase (glutamine-hydrolysing)
MPTLVLELSSRPGASGLLGATLREYGHRFRSILPERGEPLPPDLDDIDAIVLTDGPQRFASSAPAWSALAQELLRAAHAASLPIVGLGAGARLLALSLGGTVEAASGPDHLVGWHDLRLSAVGREDPLYKGVPWTTRQFLLASEVIRTLPAGGVPLATAGASLLPKAFSVGVFTFGFEHRWELDGDLFERTLAERSGELAGADATALRVGWSANGEASMRIGRRIAESIALYLMPIDRVSAGRVKDLHY